MKTTKFTFFKNTPLTDFINYIWHPSEGERDEFFLAEDHYPKITHQVSDYNYMRDRSTLNFRVDDWRMLEGVNYGTFQTENDRRYYFWVPRINYTNDKVSTITMVIDPITTFLNNRKLEAQTNLTVFRQHLTRALYNKYLHYLRTNTDVIKTSTKKYVFQDIEKFNKIVLFHCAADLEADFGNKDDPKLVTSKGGSFDNIISPVNVYSTPVDKFGEFMEHIRDYPWIGQNIKNIRVVPDVLFSGGNWEPITLKDGYGLLKLKMGTNTEGKTLGPNVGYDEFFDILGFSRKHEEHLFRNEYATIEMYSWDGQQLTLDPAQLQGDTGLKMDAKGVFGFHNELRVFPQNYATTDKEEGIISDGGTVEVFKGSFLNNSFTFSDFTELPQLIDTYTQSLASSANQRALSESKLLGNRLKDTIDPTNNDIGGKIMNAVSIASIASWGDLGGRITDQYEFYRTQKAEFADMAISAPTITSQTKGNAFQLANEIFGITLKIAAIDEVEKKKVGNYYRAMGYELGVTGENLSSLTSMRVCNYLQCTGSIAFPDIPTEFTELIRPLLENGIRLWHNPDKWDNPFAQNITTNTIIE